jgi:hypothetical protein
MVNNEHNLQKQLQWQDKNQTNERNNKHCDE